MSEIIKVKILNKNAKIPTQAHKTDSGFDLTVVEIIDKGNGVYFADCGISIEPPAGYYTQLVPRSSIYKTNFIQANSIGIIDSDYRGSLMIPMRYIGQNDGLKEAQELIGQRIAQLIFFKLVTLEIKEVDSLNDTARSSGGFGSSGS